MALIQSSGTANLSLGSTSVVWGSNTANGNMIILGVALTNAAVIGTVTSISDVQGNTYVKGTAGTKAGLTDVLNVEMWYAQNIAGGAGSVTVNHTVDACAIYAREYSGGYNYIDVMSAANGSSSTPNSGTSGTTGQAQELIINATGDDKGVTQTWTAAGGFGNAIGTATTLTGISLQDLTTAGAGVQTGTITLGASANWESLLIAFAKIGNTGNPPLGVKP